MPKPPLKVTALIAAIAAIALSVVGLIVEIMSLVGIISSVSLSGFVPASGATGFWINIAVSVLLTLVGFVLCVGGGAAGAFALAKRNTVPVMAMGVLNILYILLGDIALIGGLSLYQMFNLFTMDLPSEIFATSMTTAVISLLTNVGMSLVMLVVWIAITAMSVKGNQVIDEA